MDSGVRFASSKDVASPVDATSNDMTAKEQTARKIPKPSSLDDDSEDDDDVYEDEERSCVQGCLYRCCYLVLQSCLCFYTVLSLLKTEVTNEGRGVSKFFGKIILFVMLPCLALAAILFYFAGNPSLLAGASASWWLLFLGVRQVTTLFIALLVEHLITDICSIRSRVTERLLGPYAALFVVLANGWAATLVIWAVVDFALLAGDTKFAKQWLYWTSVDLFQEGENDPGNVVQSDLYIRLLGAAILCGALTTMKRVLVTFYLERRSLNRYAAQLESLLCRVAIVSELSHYASEASYARPAAPSSSHHTTNMGDVATATVAAHKLAKSSAHGKKGSRKGRKGGKGKHRVTSLHRSVAAPFELEEGKAIECCSKWKDTEHNRECMAVLRDFNIVNDEEEEEDDKSDHGLDVDVDKIVQEDIDAEAGESRDEEEVTAANILRFRRAVANLDTRYPFSAAFGSATSRADCAASSLRLFDALREVDEFAPPRGYKKEDPDAEGVSFRSLTAIGFSEEDGMPQREKLKAMACIFRPDKDGYLTHEEFGKAIDGVYRGVRQFRAALDNSRQIDTEFESFVAFVFNVFLVVILLMFMGVDVEEIFFSFSGIFLSFSFLIGNSASRFFEGVLVIFLERPFDVGDEISIVRAGRTDDRMAQYGTYAWHVRAVSMAKTRIMFNMTGEEAYVPNSELAYFKIINMSRSHLVILKLFFIVDMDVPFSRVLMLKEQLDQYVKERPQSWVSVDHLRCPEWNQEGGYLEYEFGMIHRTVWGMNDFSDAMYAATYCSEVAKALDIRFIANPRPVILQRSHIAAALGHLGVGGGGGGDGGGKEEMDLLTSLGAPPLKEEDESGDGYHKSYHTSVGNFLQDDVGKVFAQFEKLKKK